MNERERLSSRLGFIMLSAGCAIGCGNVWKFPWMCGQNGGGSFMLLYILCLLVLGLPVMVMEFAVGRAAQASPVTMYQRLEKPGHKWGVFGVVSLIGNIAIMAFYTVVTGWILYYFVKFLTGQNADFGFAQMIADPGLNLTYLLAVVIAAFVLLSFNLQGGLERVTKYMMSALLVLMLLALSLAVFYISRLTPGDPLQSYYGDAVQSMSSAELDAARRRLGLDGPIWEQYQRWAGNVLDGDFGMSLKYKRPVVDVVLPLLGNTLLLGGLAYALVFVLAIALALLCARFEHSALDRLICRVGTTAYYVPAFWLGVLLMLVFSVNLE